MAVRVDWDENKNRANIAKHSIEFSTGKSEFDDPLFITRLDPFPGEERFRTIVGSPERNPVCGSQIKELSGGDELYWIVSAQYATSAERKAYEEGSY